MPRKKNQTNIVEKLWEAPDGWTAPDGIGRM